MVTDTSCCLVKPLYKVQLSFYLMYPIHLIFRIKH